MTSRYHQLTRFTFGCIACMAWVVLFYSCTKCKCETVSGMGAMVKNYSHATDSFAIVEVYTKGTGYSSRDHTEPNVSIDSIYDGKGRLNFTFDLEHDYIITIYPAGKVYKLKDITLKDNSEEQLVLLASCKKCYDRITYTLNNDVYSHWVDAYADAELE